MNLLVAKIDPTLKYIGHYNKVKELLVKSSAKILNDKRKKAIQDFVLQGIPTHKNENYKYTNLQPYFNPGFKYIHLREPAVADLNTVFQCDVPQLDTFQAFIFNGWYYEKGCQTNGLPDNVILSSLENISFEKPELIKKYGLLADTASDPLVALNTAFAKDGYFLYVPKKSILKKPIQIINFLQSDKNAFVTQRNFIYVEEGADVKIISCDHTLNLNSYLNNSVTEIFVEQNASLEYYALQNQHNNTVSLNSVFIRQQQNSMVTTLNSSLHGGLIRNNLKVVLDGENASANLYGIAFIDRNQHIDNFTKVIHAKPHCQSNQIYKTVLDDSSTGAFSGRIHVMRDAQKTNAFQRSNNLLLSDKATMQAKPQLIIDADDVKCSHGATVGQINEEALFYIRTRGIEEKEARLMLMNAFAHEVIQQIKVTPLRNRINELVEKRLKGEVARCHECAYNCEC